MLNRLLDSQFEILAALRTGEFAATHYGWDHRGQRPVAIAEVFPDSARDTSYRRRFVGSFNRTRRLVHPNLVAIYDARQDADDRIYVIMEFLDGMELDTALDRLRERKKRLPPALALFVTRQVLQGLDYIYTHAGGEAYAQSPLLEAFSPGDVILVAGGAVKLRGVGFSAPRGTYPEFPDNRERPTAESYDLGVIGGLLYELLVGDPPPGAGDPPPLGGARADWDLLRLAGLHKRVTEVVRRALSSRPEVRYETAREMLDDIERAEDALGASDQAGMLADLLDALEDPAEAQEHRRLLMMRGSAEAKMQSVATTPLRAEALTATSIADASDDAAGWTESQPQPWVRPESGDLGDLREGPRRRRGWIFGFVAAVLLAYLVGDIYWGFGPLGRLTGSGARDATGEAGRYGKVVTVPPGAELTLNGELAGRTPCALDKLPAGPVTLRLTYPGLLPIDTVLIIKKGEPLEPLPPFIFHCRIHFSSVPAGAKVMVDGHELSDMELARFVLAVTDTVNVVMTVEGEQPLLGADFNPLIGFVSSTDTTIWQWRPRSEDSPGVLMGVFRREIRIHSDPPGALVYVDEDSVASGYTNLSLPLPYGDHIITLHRERYMDYRFAMRVGQETPGVLSAVLKRTVHIGAIDRSNPDTDIGATIEWIRRGSSYIKTPFDKVKTPYSIQLDGLTHEVLLRHEDYWDTTAHLSIFADRLEIVMRPLSDYDRRYRDDRDDNSGEEAWVRFQVRDGSGPVADAEVIGVEKSTGVVVRYGMTGETGQVVTKVPPGDYDWRATKNGYDGRMNGERIKPGAGLKKITLRLARR